MRSTSDTFRDEIESILDTILPKFIPPDRLITIRASEVTESFDWAALLERLAGGDRRVPPPWRRPVTLYPTLWD